MKKFLFGILIGGIIFSSITAYATYVYTARDITYSPEDEHWNVDNIQDAIDELKETCSTPVTSGGGIPNCSGNLLDDCHTQSEFFVQYRGLNGSGNEISSTGSRSVTKTNNKLTITTLAGNGPSGKWYRTSTYCYTPILIGTSYTKLHYRISNISTENSLTSEKKIYVQNVVTGETFEAGSLTATGEQTVDIPESFRNNLVNNAIRVMMTWAEYDNDSQGTVTFDILELTN